MAQDSAFALSIHLGARDRRRELKKLFSQNLTLNPKKVKGDFWGDVAGMHLSNFKQLVAFTIRGVHAHRHSTKLMAEELQAKYIQVF